MKEERRGTREAALLGSTADDAAHGLLEESKGRTWVEHGVGEEAALGCSVCWAAGGARVEEKGASVALRVDAPVVIQLKENLGRRWDRQGKEKQKGRR